MRTRAWAAFLTAGGVLTAAYFVVPGLAGKDLLYQGVGALSVAAMIVGIRRYRPHPVLPFVAFTVGMALMWVADAIWAWYEVVLKVEPPYPGIPDIVYLLTYPTLFVGAAALVRGARDRRGVGLESWIIAVGASVLIWQFLMEPTFSSTTSSLAARVLSALYPAVDILLVAIITRLLILGLWRNPCILMIEVAFLSALFADLVYGVHSLTGSYFTGIWYDAGWLLQYLLLGAALLHPSVRRVGESVRDTEPVRLSRRLLALALAGLVAPGVMAVETVAGQSPDILVVTTIWVLLFLLVVVRMRDLVTALDSLFRQMRHRAHHDALTGLENRASFTERVEAALGAGGRPFAVAYLDLDKFKEINDTEGHAAGDDLLVTVADRMRSGVRATDVVARIGGDEFAVYAPDVTSDDQAAQLARRLSESMSAPFTIAGRQLGVGVSVGVAMSRPRESFDILMSRADAAMYRAKRRQVGSHRPPLSEASGDVPSGPAPRSDVAPGVRPARR